MRKILIGIAALGGLAIAGAALIYLLVDVNQFRPTIQAELQKQLHRPVTLGAMSLGLFPLAVRVDDVSVGERDGFQTGRPFITAKQIRVRAELLPLLSKQVRVDSLTLNAPVVELVKNAAGQWNYSDLTNPPKSANSEPASLSLLQVDDGSLAASDLGKTESRSVYEHVNAEITDLGANKTFHAKVSAQLPGAKIDSLSFEGSGGPSGANSTPFSGKVTLTDAPLAGLARFAGSALPIDGKLSGTAEFQSTGGAISGNVRFELKDAIAEGRALGFPVTLNGSLKADPATEVSRFTGSLQAGKVPISLAGEMNGKNSTISAAVRLQDASLHEVLGLARLLGAGDLSGNGIVSLALSAQGPEKGPLTYSGAAALRNADLTVGGIAQPVKIPSTDVTFAGNSAHITGLVASLGSSNLKGSATVTDFTSPKVAFDFDADKIDIDELQKLTAAGNAGAKTPGKAKEPATLTAKGSLHVGTLSSQGIVLTNVRSQCDWQNGIATLSPLSAGIFGGTQTGSIKADTRRQPVSIEMNLKMQNVDANQLLSTVSSVKNTLFGNLAASGDLRLTTGSADIARTLNGTLNLNLQKGRLAGTSILNELSTVGKFAGLSSGAQNFTSITQMGGDIAIVNGQATTNNLNMQMEGGSLSAAGSANLADQTLNLKITAVLEKSLSQQAGGTSIGGYLTSALANNKGELVIPAVVTGTFAKPHFTPDAARVAELKLKNVLPSLGGGGKSILDAVTGRRSESPSGKPDSAPAPKNDVQGIIDLFKKKK